jgi:hypothetical protein
VAPASRNEACLVRQEATEDHIRFIVDSGATISTINRKSMLYDFKTERSQLNTAGNQKLPILGHGILNPTLPRVHYVPKCRVDLLSVPQLDMQGHATLFQKSKVYVLPKPLTLVDKPILTGNRDPFSDLYQVDVYCRSSVAAMEAESYLAKHATKQLNQAVLWHHRLGHAYLPTIFQGMKQGLFTGVRFSKQELEAAMKIPCHYCIVGKQTRSRIPKTGGRTKDVTEPYELILVDHVGPMDPIGYGETKYMLVAVDAYTKYKWTLPVTERKGMCEVFQELVKTITRGIPERQQFTRFAFLENFQKVQTDGAREFIHKDLQEYFAKSSIKHEFACADTHHQAGPVEKSIQDLTRTSRCMILRSGLPQLLFPYSFKYACNIRNRLPHSGNPDNKSPHQMMFDAVPTLKYHKVFGSQCYVWDIISDGKKHYPRSYASRFLGFDPGYNGYLVLTKTGKVLPRFNIHFEERGFGPAFDPAVLPHIRANKENPEDFGEGHNIAVRKNVYTDPQNIVFQKESSNSSVVLNPFPPRTEFIVPPAIPEAVFQKESSKSSVARLRSSVSPTGSVNAPSKPASAPREQKRSMPESKISPPPLEPPTPAPPPSTTPKRQTASSMARMLLRLKKTNPPATPACQTPSVAQGTPNVWKSPEPPSKPSTKTVPLRVSTRPNKGQHSERLITANIACRLESSKCFENYLKWGTSEIPVHSPLSSVPFIVNALHVAPASKIKVPLSVKDLPPAADIPVPNNPEEAARSQYKHYWQESMESECKSMEDNKVWRLVTLPSGKKTIKARWVYKVKPTQTGQVDRFRSRLVAKGYAQRLGIDFNETFAPVSRLETFKLLMAKANFDADLMVQFDVSTAFLIGELKEEVYLELPKGVHIGNPNKLKKPCLKLLKSIYGLKQSSRVFWLTFRDHMLSEGFKQCSADPCCFVKDGIVCSIHVDDGLAGCRTQAHVDSLRKSLEKKFPLSHFGEVKYVLAMAVDYDRKGGVLKLSQSAYINQLVKSFKLENASSADIPHIPGARLTKAQCPKSTAVHTSTKEPRYRPFESPNPLKPKKPSKSEDNSPHPDLHRFRELIGSLLYVSRCTRPDIIPALREVSQFCCNPGHAHYRAALRILRYLKGTSKFALTFRRKRSNASDPTIAYCDSDWAGNADHRRSVSGYVIYALGAAIVCSSKFQNLVATSTCEAEYTAMTACCLEIMWLRNLLADIGHPQTKPTTVFCDNTAAISVAKSLTVSARTRHFSWRQHKIRELVANKTVHPLYVHTTANTADAFTKGLNKTAFRAFMRAVLQQD